MPKRRASASCKGSRNTEGRAGRPKKRKRPLNASEKEQETASTSTSAKKLQDRMEDVEIDAKFGYRIINFVAVFSAISDHVKCSTCGGKVEFLESSIRGLGFKILITCNACDPRGVLSSPLINGHAYDINRRITFAMRLLGQGLAGIEKFCGIMDLPRPVFRKSYVYVQKNISCAAKAVWENIRKKAGEEEKMLTSQVETCEQPNGLIVSGDGTWKKRGFSSLYGVCTVIGHYSKKVLDVEIKSSYCKACVYWEKEKDTENYAEWKETHDAECFANHTGSAGKMEVDAIVDIFRRSFVVHGIKYLFYVGDGDSKTFAGILKSKPYGDNVLVQKKECIGHVQKRMGTRLRNVKKANKGLGGRGKLTGKLIDELTVYYGLAIRRHCNSLKDMKKAIWATFYHKISTDENPQHNYCPTGADSWCTFQKACAEGKLNEYRHKPALPQDVRDAILPVYEALSTDDLLNRCLGGYNQNCNESVNSVIWKIAPKISSEGAEVVEIAAYIACSTFNEGAMAYLNVMQMLNLKIGDKAHQWCMRLAAEDVLADAEGLQYGAGTAE